jgi:hypothetical protein
MPCSTGQAEIDYYGNEEAYQYLTKNKITVNNHAESNSILCGLCGQMTKQELIDKKLYKWYLKHLCKDVMDSSHPVERMVREVLRIEQSIELKEVK